MVFVFDFKLAISETKLVYWTSESHSVGATHGIFSFGELLTMVSLQVLT